MKKRIHNEKIFFSLALVLIFCSCLKEAPEVPYEYTSNNYEFDIAISKITLHNFSANPSRVFSTSPDLYFWFGNESANVQPGDPCSFEHQLINVNSSGLPQSIDLPIPIEVGSFDRIGIYVNSYWTQINYPNMPCHYSGYMVEGNTFLEFWPVNKFDIIYRNDIGVNSFFIDPEFIYYDELTELPTDTVSMLLEFEFLWLD